MPIYNAKVLSRGKHLFHTDIHRGERSYRIDIDSLVLPVRCSVEWKHKNGTFMGTATNFRRTEEGLFCHVIPCGTGLQEKRKCHQDLKISPTIEYDPFDDVLKNGVLKNIAVCPEATDDATFIREISITNNQPERRKSIMDAKNLVMKNTVQTKEAFPAFIGIEGNEHVVHWHGKRHVVGKLGDSKDAIGLRINSLCELENAQRQAERAESDDKPLKMAKTIHV